ncbi:MAG: hypothetical protein HOJ35_11655 [Bdellovibrionales bacterium]|nr:hypothetical protein [Bdellovibrionales bacterium]
MNNLQLPLVSRIAPTPSGYLHIGNAVNFIITWLYVQKFKGELILRIDDLDSSRVRDKYIDDIFFQLDWLGINIDKGPSGSEEFKNKYSQKYRITLYDDFIKSIKFNGAFLYNCSCSRTMVKKLYHDSIYRGHCRNLNLKGIGSKRIKVDNSELFELMGDFIVYQKNNRPSYQVASLVDDIFYKVNLIIRGEDLWPSTQAQGYLSCFVNDNPFKNIICLHHPLLKDSKNNKLSKSSGATSLKELRKDNSNLQYIYNLVSRVLGINIKVDNLNNLLDEFIKIDFTHKFNEIV